MRLLVYLNHHFKVPRHASASTETTLSPSTLSPSSSLYCWSTGICEWRQDARCKMQDARCKMQDAASTHTTCLLKNHYLKVPRQVDSGINWHDLWRINSDDMSTWPICLTETTYVLTSWRRMYDDVCTHFMTYLLEDVSRTPPPPGGFSIYYVPSSRAVCKRFHDEMRPSHLVVKSLTHGSWWGNIVNRKPSRGGGFLSINLKTCLEVDQYTFQKTSVYTPQETYIRCKRDL